VGGAQRKQTGGGGGESINELKMAGLRRPDIITIRKLRTAPLSQDGCFFGARADQYVK